MAIDAHTQYVYDWDKLIVEEWKRIENEMAALSTYTWSYAHIGSNFTTPTVPTSHHLYMYGKHADDYPDDMAHVHHQVAETTDAGVLGRRHVL